MSIIKEEKKELLNKIYSDLKKINIKCLKVSNLVLELKENGYVTGSILIGYYEMEELRKKVNEVFLVDVENSINSENDDCFIDVYQCFYITFDEFTSSVFNLEWFSNKLFKEYLKIKRTINETKVYLDKIDVLLDSIYKQDYIFTCDSNYLVFKDKFDVLNKKYLKWIATYNEKLLLIMLEQSSGIVLEYYSILCEIYGSVRYLLEDDLYYYCRNNKLQYKM